MIGPASSARTVYATVTPETFTPSFTPHTTTQSRFRIFPNYSPFFSMHKCRRTCCLTVPSCAKDASSTWASQRLLVGNALRRLWDSLNIPFRFSRKRECSADLYDNCETLQHSLSQCDNLINTEMRCNTQIEDFLWGYWKWRGVRNITHIIPFDHNTSRTCTARWTGAAPRYNGSRLGWTFTVPEKQSAHQLHFYIKIRCLDIKELVPSII